MISWVRYTVFSKKNSQKVFYLRSQISVFLTQNINIYSLWLINHFPIHGSHRSWHTFLIRTFQGLLRYIFKEFSRTFLCSFHRPHSEYCPCSFQHPFAKKWSTMDFSNKTYRDHLILSSPENGGGGIWVCVFNPFFLDDLLYYGDNTAWNNSAWKGGLGVFPQNILIRISTKYCNSGGHTSLFIMSQ